MGRFFIRAKITFAATELPIKQRNKKHTSLPVKKSWLNALGPQLLMALFKANCLPEKDDDSVENIESIADVLEDAVGGELEDHLDGKNDAKDQVADLHGFGQPLGLQVILDAHAEGVDEDAKEDETLANVVVHKLLQMSLTF